MLKLHAPLYFKSYDKKTIPFCKNVIGVRCKMLNFFEAFNLFIYDPSPKYHKIKIYKTLLEKNN